MTFISHLTDGDSLSEATRDVALEQLSVFQEVDSFLGDIGDPIGVFGGLQHLGEQVLGDLRSALARASDEDVLAWVQETYRAINAHFDSLPNVDPSDFDRGVHISRRLRALNQRASVLQDQAALRAATVKLNEELQDSAAKAKDAAGIIGTASLATYFGNYGDREARSANAFRISALGGFVAAVVFALVFGNGTAGTLVSFDNEWTALAFKAAGAVGIGGIAAYLARQSGQHRRMANWARSMEVQLQSFPAFIEPLEYAQQADMYSLLARRVLTAPPEKSGTSSEDSVGPAQLIDVLTSIVKRSNTPGAAG